MTEKIIPDGYKLVAVKGLDELVYWLERCKDKGHLENCADLIEPFEAFEYRNVSEEAVIATHEAKAAPAVPAWVQDVVIEYQYNGGTHWCPLGPAERAKVDFDGVYRLKPGTIPTESPTPAVPAETFDEVWAAIDWNEWRMKPIRELIQMIHSKTPPAAPSQPAVPQGEPVLVQHRKPIVGKDGETIGYTSWIDGNGLDWWPHRSLYATQSQPSKYGSPELQALIVTHATKSQPVTLTDEELEECFRRAHEETNTAYVPIARFPIGWRLYGRQVIAALREKEGK